MKGPNAINQPTKPPEEEDQEDSDDENVDAKENTDPNVQGASQSTSGRERVFARDLLNANVDTEREVCEEPKSSDSKEHTLSFC